jgi:DNA (cytosine-5)-methyltransferase 1
MQRRPTIVDLFCGAGGLSMGFIEAGFRVLRSFDFVESAVETYRHNLGKHVALLDLSHDVELPKVDAIVGGPPCQGFSSAGMRRAGDLRNNLVARFASLVAQHRPSAFVFENVEGFLTAERGNRVFDLLRPLIAAGYRIHLRKINAANYGVCQHRKRVIAVGGLGWDPSFPEPTHAAFGAPGASLAGFCLPRTPTLGDALEGLPTPSTTFPGMPDGHYFKPLRDLDLERAKGLEPGQTMRDLPAELWHESYKRRAFRRVMDGTPTERRGGAPCGVRRLRLDEPSKAITSGAVSEFIHPVQHRPLTIRECARIQTFPDHFLFRGTQAEQVQLIGNAVPPLLAEVFARALAHDLLEAEVRYGRGELLSFVPTLSTGMSPVLSEIDRLVRSTFLPCNDRPAQLLLWD